MTKRKRKENPIVTAILKEYQPKSVEDMQNALKDIFGPMFEAMLKGEMDTHLGYYSNERTEKQNNNRRNGYSHKNIKTSFGEAELEVPRDRDSSFEPQIIKKRQKDVSDIESKVLSLYDKGVSQRDISDIIEDIYGFEMSAEMISNITDNVIEELEQRQKRPLKSLYTFLFVDYMYIPIKRDYETKECAIYTILGYDIDGKKDILGLLINDTESKHT